MIDIALFLLMLVVFLTIIFLFVGAIYGIIEAHQNTLPENRLRLFIRTIPTYQLMFWLISPPNNKELENAVKKQIDLRESDKYNG